MFKKIFVSAICLMVALTLFGSGYLEYNPGSEFELDVVTVSIKEEFQQQFEEEQFTIEDFEWENVDWIRYVKNFTGGGNIKVYLKEQGREEVLEAIEHFETLNFVQGANVRLRFAIDKFILCVKEDYHQEFIERQFIVEEFGWNNAESITYKPWYSNSNDRLITIHLIEHGRDEVLDAIEYFRRLKFVKDAYVSSFMYID